MLRLTHDCRPRHYEKVKLDDLILDIVKWKGFAVLAIENVKEELQYSHTFKRSPKTFKRSPKTEPPL